MPLIANSHAEHAPLLIEDSLSSVSEFSPVMHSFSSGTECSWRSTFGSIEGLWLFGS